MATFLHPVAVSRGKIEIQNQSGSSVGYVVENRDKGADSGLNKT
ncbi:hypothetical protein [Rahnella inusitata]|nr:hypothetical protein [Rahnella inusitata]